MKNIDSVLLKNNMLKNFKSNNIIAIYGYGSGIIPQKNNLPKMIDLIFIVKNTKEFHEENLKINSNHYSKIAYYFNYLLNFANNKGTQVYYNSNIILDNQINIKYGLISLNNFSYNLHHWNNLFISGRFHKPVLQIYKSENIEEIKIIEDSIDFNRRQAVKYIKI
jgi:translocator assembly and maintenance protein 41